MGASTDMLTSLCKAITAPGDTALDSVWAAIVLVVYLCCHPSGRELLRGTNLTDVDYQTASVFEAYGRAEFTRRARLQTQQASASAGKGRKKPKSKSEEVKTEPDAGTGAKVEEDDLELAGLATDDMILSGVAGGPNGDEDDVFGDIEAQERLVLGTKRKRGAKGCASASTSDSLGVRIRSKTITHWLRF